MYSVDGITIKLVHREWQPQLQHQHRSLVDSIEASVQRGGHPFSEEYLLNDLHLYCRNAIDKINSIHRAGSTINSISASVSRHLQSQHTQHTHTPNFNTTSTHNIMLHNTDNTSNSDSTSTNLNPEVRATSPTSTSIPTDLKTQHLQEKHHNIYMIDRVDINQPQALQHQHWEDNYDTTSYI